MKFAKRLVGMVGAAAVALSLFAGTSQIARAEEITCRGTLGAITVDNLRVPQKATCTLKGTTVQGTILVERGATLQASGVRVNGNVQGEGAARVNVLGSSTVGGSIQVKQGGAARIERTAVNADIQFDQNSGALVASRNTVGGSIQVIQNTGGVTLSNNRVNGNLQCKENNPAPTGGGNIVQGVKEDQCAGL